MSVTSGWVKSFSVKMPAGVSWPRYLRMLGSCLLAMFAGAQVVHQYYLPDLSIPEIPPKPGELQTELQGYKVREEAVAALQKLKAEQKVDWCGILCALCDGHSQANHAQSLPTARSCSVAGSRVISGTSASGCILCSLFSSNWRNTSGINAALLVFFCKGKWSYLEHSCFYWTASCIYLLFMHFFILLTVFRFLEGGTVMLNNKRTVLKSVSCWCFNQAWKI